MDREVHVNAEQTVRMRATAATVIWYRQKFGKDFLQEFAEIGTKGTDEVELYASGSSEAILRLGYIMARSADRENVPEDLTEWLERFDKFDLALFMEETISLWAESQCLTLNVESKNV